MSGFPQRQHNFQVHWSNEKKIATIPYKDKDNRIVVTATINGVPGFELLIDTGAPQAYLGTNTKFEELGVQPMASTGLTGLEKPVSIRLGAFEINNVRVQTHSPWPAETAADYRHDGSLGYELFAGAIVEVDPKKKTLTIYSPEHTFDQLPDHILDLAFIKDSRHAMTALKVVLVAGQPPLTAVMILDTGFTGKLAFYKSELIGELGLRDEGEIIADTLAGPLVLEKRVVASMTWQDLSMVNISVLIINRENRIFSASENMLEGLLGYSFLSKYKFAIDYNREVVYLFNN